MKIKILKEDILPYVYFVCSIAHETEGGMHGTLSAKSDFIGGIFDRWINIIPESIIFNKAILPKVSDEIKKVTGKEYNIRVFSDFFKYQPTTVGIAPDVLGIRVNDIVIPFVKYDDRQPKKEHWVPVGNSPQIEVKSFKNSHYLSSLRNQNYDNKYLVMVETNLANDYLLPFFDNSVFDDNVFDKLEVPNDFITSNDKELLTKTNKINRHGKLGTIELLLVTSAQEFMRESRKCYGGESPRYIVAINQRKIKIKDPETIGIFSTFFDKMDNGLYRPNETFEEFYETKNVKTMDMYFSDIDALELIRINKGGFVLRVGRDMQFNNHELKGGEQYTVNLNILDRSNAQGQIDKSDTSSEYFIDKNLLRFIKSREDELIENIAKIIKERID